MEYIVQLLASFLAVMLVITLHEFAHAFVAYKCGDPTAKFAGRMTLNPIKHFDPLGILMFALAGFGWARPVPVNPYNFRKYRIGSFWTSAAGILVNYFSAFFVFYPLMILTQLYVLPIFQGKYMAIFLHALTWYFYSYSISFAVFNFLPVYPLDGFRMWDALDRKNSKILNFLRANGSYILMGLILINVFASYMPILNYINVLRFAMQTIGGGISWPIVKFWALIF
jgi:Zn-dependent protease